MLGSNTTLVVRVTAKNAIRTIVSLNRYLQTFYNFETFCPIMALDYSVVQIHCKSINTKKIQSHCAFRTTDCNDVLSW